MAKRRSSRRTFWPAALLAVVLLIIGAGAGLAVFQRTSIQPATPAGSTPREPAGFHPPSPAQKPAVPPAPGGGNRAAREGSRSGTRDVRASARVAVIFDDAGGSLQDLERIMAIGRPTTVAVLPGLGYSKEVADRAQASGLEVFLHLPLAADDASKALGPGGISTTMSDEEITATVIADLAAVPGAIGVNNHMGSRGTADERVMRAVLKVVKDHGLIFVDSITSGRSIAAPLAEEMGIPTGRRHVFLDNVDEPPAIRAQLRRLITVARRRGSAIGIGHAHRLTPGILAEMLPEFDRLGIELVPVSALVK